MFRFGPQKTVRGTSERRGRRQNGRKPLVAIGYEKTRPFSWPGVSVNSNSRLIPQDSFWLPKSNPIRTALRVSFQSPHEHSTAPAWAEQPLNGNLALSQIATPGPVVLLARSSHVDYRVGHLLKQTRRANSASPLTPREASKTGRSSVVI